MKRTLYIATAVLLAMPMAGNEVDAQSMLQFQVRHFAPGIDGQSRGGSIFRQSRKKRLHSVVRIGGSNLSTAKMWMLTNELDLTEEQAVKLFPRMKANQKQRDALVKKRKELLKIFNKKAEDEKASVRDIEKFADELANIEKDLIDLKTKFIKGTKNILNPSQQAVFAIFEERSRGRLRDRLIDSRVRIELEPYFEFYQFDNDDDDD